MTAQQSSESAAAGPQTAVWTLMTRAVARISPDAHLDEVAHKLTAVGAGALGVGTTEALTGVVSERDVTRAFGMRDEPAAVTAGAIASTELVWCDPETTAAEAAQAMCDAGVRHLLVGDADKGDLQGIVSARDLIEALIAG
jgi:CBS domain-containing protein